MKEVYDYCIKVDWDEAAVSKYASEMGLTYEELIEQLLIYLKKEVDVNIYNQIIEKINSNKTDDEYFEINVLNPVLLNKFGVKTYRIWRNEEEKGIVLEEIYKTWLENKKNIELIMSSFGTSKENVQCLLKMYAVKYLKFDEKVWLKQFVEENIMEKHDNTVGVSKLFAVYEGLINAESLEDIIKVINDSGNDTTYLRSHLHDYLIKYRRNDYDEYMALIKSKIKMYSGNKKTQKKAKDKIEREEARKKRDSAMLPEAIRLIKIFINSPYRTIDEFIKKSQIITLTQSPIIEIFNKSLDLIKEYNKELYGIYLDKLQKEKEKYYNDHINEVYTIISLLKNGIDENGMKRVFDLIDYFQLTNLTFNEVMDFTKQLHKKQEITAKEYSLISRFTAFNKNSQLDSEKELSNIYNEIRTMNVIRRSEAGVLNTVETITDETKDKLINYLRDNSIPVNYLTYCAALNRYKFGYIMFDNYKAY